MRLKRLRRPNSRRDRCPPDNCCAAEAARQDGGYHPGGPRASRYQRGGGGSALPPAGPLDFAKRIEAVARRAAGEVSAGTRAAPGRLASEERARATAAARATLP